jgi:prepilin-type N-terminal cleavage/methylation domain-containing protein
MQGVSVRRKGFTLVELIVVVTIVAVLTGASVPYLGRYVSRRQLELAGFSLVQDLRRVQMDAVFTRTDRKLQFIPGSNWYRFETEAGSLVLPPKLDGLYVRQLGGSVGFPKAFGKYSPSSAYFGGSSSNACPPSGVVILTFNAFGRPSEGGGRVTLVDRAGDQVDIIVTPVIGRIRMEWVH